MLENEALGFQKTTKFAFVLIILSILIGVLFIGQSIIIPLVFSMLIAILLRPVVIFLNKKFRFPNVIAVLVTVVIFLTFILAIVFFVSWQISDITDDWIKIKRNLSIHFENTQHWIKQRFHLSYKKQQNYIQQVTNETLNGDSQLMGNTISSFTDMMLSVTLIPIYTFLILLYRNLFVKFLYKIVPQKNEQTLKEILSQIKSVVQGYIVGLLIEMGVVCVLTTGGLMLLGVEYAILLGLITAILNMVPYIGILFAALISILVTLVNTNELSLVLGVVGLSVAVQFIDNNILVPKIVGNKVRINALASVLGVIIGGSIAGISGMFLAIPLIAILKVVFDRIESLEPWGMLLGDDLQKTFDWYRLKLPNLDHGDSEEVSSNDSAVKIKDK